jgi:hypothetical protein
MSDYPNPVNDLRRHVKRASVTALNHRDKLRFNGPLRQNTKPSQPSTPRIWIR